MFKNLLGQHHAFFSLLHHSVHVSLDLRRHTKKLVIMTSMQSWVDYRSRHPFAAFMLALPGASTMACFGLAAGMVAGTMFSLLPALVSKNPKLINTCSGASAMLGYVVCGTIAANRLGGAPSVVAWLIGNAGLVAVGILTKNSPRHPF